MCYGGMCNSGKLDDNRRKNISLATKYIDHMFFLNPDLGKFLPKEKSSFLPYSIAAWKTLDSKDRKIENDIFRIVHAPTNRITKGSNFLINAVERINRKRKIIDLILVENTPYENAIEIYKTADLVIDQLLIGWYGALCVEVMKLGVPVGFFLNDIDRKYLPSGMFSDLEDAAININPFKIEETILNLIDDKMLLKSKREAGLDYVNKWHSPTHVGSITREVYER